jgi:hypothetical protein
MEAGCCYVPIDPYLSQNQKLNILDALEDFDFKCIIVPLETK